MLSPDNIRKMGKHAASQISRAIDEINAARRLSAQPIDPKVEPTSVTIAKVVTAHRRAAAALENAVSLIRNITG